ncbi:STAS domain-containing protein [Roseospira visakhapatnamensis]|uniref:Anti-anti-sigma factor n=1 Tax=Roseospira visakhapatnamensis TaxID=390880 RepID=A0A7W6RC13_9PROT|nr:STAS domain-containing protein [Roseospira visakhapatnamensis]MBB4265751.1 anti-anti-sigma factor [Roseospira visakhapatnamensis]
MVTMVCEQGGETALVVFQGDLTHAVFDSFSQLLDRLHTIEAERYILDLSEVGFIDSSGIGMLLMAQDHAEQRACGCALRGIGPAVWQTLMQAHASDLFFFEPTPDPDGDAATVAA